MYKILRRRPALAEPRITYGELARRLRKRTAFGHIGHRSRELYAALVEVGRECRRLGLPPLPALVVRADTRRPGAAYYTGRWPGDVPSANPVAAWWDDLERVKRSRYPPR